MFDDNELNLSDAILHAMHRAWPDWIPLLVPKGGEVEPQAAPVAKRVRAYRHIPRPQGLRAPQGVTWNAHNGRFCSRFHVDCVRIPIGTCEATQEALDALGERWQMAARLRDAGATADAIRQAMKEAA